MASEFELKFDEPVWNTSWRQIESKKQNRRVMDLRLKKSGRIMLSGAL